MTLLGVIDAIIERVQHRIDAHVREQGKPRLCDLEDDVAGTGLVPAPLGLDHGIRFASLDIHTPA